VIALRAAPLAGERQPGGLVEERQRLLDLGIGAAKTRFSASGPHFTRLIWARRRISTMARFASNVSPVSTPLSSRKRRNSSRRGLSIAKSGFRSGCDWDQRTEKLKSRFSRTRRET